MPYKDPEKAKEWRSANKDKLAAANKKWQIKNPEKSKAYNKKWQANNPEKVKKRQKKFQTKNPDKIKNAQLKYKYGVLLEQYKIMESAQEGRCAICKKISKLVIDHCHTTKLIRELLCSPCNMMLGLAKDNIVTLSNAVKYLEKHKP